MVSTYPKSPTVMVKGMPYFARMLDKIRLARGELGTDYENNFGAPFAADGACCAFLQVEHAKLRERVAAGGTDEEIFEWCCENGRRPTKFDLRLWNSFTEKLGWRDFASAPLQEAKKNLGIEHRDDIDTIPKLIDYDEGRIG